MANSSKNTTYVQHQGGNAAAYILGMIGAAIYYISVADGFGEIVVALLKSLVWPAYLVNGLLGIV